MRYVLALLLAVVMLMVVPWLWQRAMMAEVNKIAAEDPVVLASEPITTSFNSAEIGNISAAMNPQVNTDTEKYEQLGVQSKVDETQRQVRQAESYVAP
jgi:hypothetical protein